METAEEDFTQIVHSSRTLLPRTLDTPWFKSYVTVLFIWTGLVLYHDFNFRILRVATNHKANVFRQPGRHNSSVEDDCDNSDGNLFNSCSVPMDLNDYK